MKTSIIQHFLTGALISCSTVRAQQVDLELRARIVRDHAAWCHQLYSDVEAQTKKLRSAIQLLLEAPSKATLDGARQAWVEARKIYGKTEALRFHDGPIEPLEPLINAWPLDEAYVDYVVGEPESGIINHPERYPSLSGSVLTLANEAGGEANICLGWHAIEFMLWGQDLSPDGPGRRPHTDFVDGQGKNAKRRREYLTTVVDVLVTHIGQARAAWAVDAPYRRKFEADPNASLRRILTGVTVLTAFELGGERLTVAFDTRDQEQEHSCFSDTTHNDFEANQLGLIDVVRGGHVKGKKVAGLLDLLEKSNPKLARVLTSSMTRTLEALKVMPIPFDRGIGAMDGSPERRAIESAIEALESQADILLIVGKHLGYDLPIEPGE